MRRKEFDDIVSDMMRTYSEYSNQFAFYGYIMSKCKVQFDTIEKVKTAGVYFDVNKWVLEINSEFFLSLSKEHRMGLIQHEMMHVILMHQFREKELKEKLEYFSHDGYNVACDLAINQEIKEGFLPTGGVTLEHYDFPKDKTSEEYYDMLPKEISDKPMDNHDIWEEGKGSPDMAKNVTQKMVEDAVAKAKGSAPSWISDVLKLYNTQTVVDWRKALRNIVGSKRINKRPTIKRRSRRFPNREDIRGKTKDVLFDVVVALDISGSMSNDEIVYGLNEIKNICKLTNSNLKILQIDTEVHTVDDFDAKKTEFERNGIGGTYMYPATEYIKDNNIPCDALVFITDGYIESSWPTYPKYKVIWLTTENHLSLDISNQKNMTRFDLNVKKENNA